MLARGSLPSMDEGPSQSTGAPSPGREPRLEGIHHITAIAAHAQGVIDFYAGLLGMRLVKKTVNFDAPDVYHLYLGDELGHPGSVLTFFEFPGARPGRAGAGMVHRIVWRVGSDDSLDFWEERLRGQGLMTERMGRTLRFADPELLELELEVDDGADQPLSAAAADVPPEHALRGFGAARAYSEHPEASADLLGRVLGFEQQPPEQAWRVATGERHATYTLDLAPVERGIQGAGTVHHIAWCSPDADHELWRERVVDAGAHATPIIDREYFRSVYFREPSGVLFEIATAGPGFTVDEPAEHLGEQLCLPPQHEHLRDRLERSLTPLDNPRSAERGR
jgi:glyoxalase family protein